MHKYWFLLLLTVLPYVAHAQFDQWTVYAGGLGSYAQSKNIDLTGDSEQMRRNTLLNVSVGIFPVRKLVVGVGVSFIQSRDKEENIVTPYSVYDRDQKALSYSVNPFVRYYLVKGFYTEAGYLFGKSRVTSESMIFYPPGYTQQHDAETKFLLRGLRVGAGYSLFLNAGKTIALDAGVAYQRYNYGPSYSGLAVNLGVSAFIFKKIE